MCRDAASTVPGNDRKVAKCAVKEEDNFFFKKVQKHTTSKMAACLHGNSRWPLFFFVKLYVALPIHRCIDLSNTLRINREAMWFNMCNSMGEYVLRTPQNPPGGYFCHPSKSKWEVCLPRNNHHHLAKLLHAM